MVGDKTLAGEEDLLLTSDKTPTFELESFEQIGGEPDTKETKADDQSTPDGKEGSYLAGDKTLVGEEDLLLTSDKTPTVDLESSEQIGGEPDTKETKALVAVDVKMMDFVAQEGVEAVERMVHCDANPDSPVFLRDMVKNSKKQKKHDDGKFFWL